MEGEPPEEGKSHLGKLIQSEDVQQFPSQHKVKYPDHPDDLPTPVRDFALNGEELANLSFDGGEIKAMVAQIATRSTSALLAPKADPGTALAVPGRRGAAPAAAAAAMPTLSQDIAAAITSAMVPMMQFMVQGVERPAGGIASGSNQPWIRPPIDLTSAGGGGGGNLRVKMLGNLL